MNGRLARMDGPPTPGNCKQALHNRPMREQCHTPNRSAHGFTLIELMVTVIVAGILAAIAIPGYQTYMMKSRREDARTTLSAMVQAQERSRSNSTSYSSDPTFLVSGVASTATSASSFNGHYDMTVADLVPPVNFISGYEVHAKPKRGDPQAQDTACGDIFIRVSGGNLSYRDVNMAANATSSPCWPQ